MMLFGTPARIATAEDVLLHKLHWNSISCSLDGKDASGVQQLPLRGSVEASVARGCHCRFTTTNFGASTGNSRAFGHGMLIAIIATHPRESVR
jgi:hypothetical protein